MSLPHETVVRYRCVAKSCTITEFSWEVGEHVWGSSAVSLSIRWASKKAHLKDIVEDVCNSSGTKFNDFCVETLLSPIDSV